MEMKADGYYRMLIKVECANEDWIRQVHAYSLARRHATPRHELQTRLHGVVEPIVATIN